MNDFRLNNTSQNNKNRKLIRPLPRSKVCQCQDDGIQRHIRGGDGAAMASKVWRRVTRGGF